MIVGLSSPDGHGGVEVKGADALVIRGLLQELPPVGTVWPEERRREWVAAIVAAFAVLYEAEDSHANDGGGTLSPSTLCDSRRPENSQAKATE